jgi:hypothetical protein
MGVMSTIDELYRRYLSEYRDAGDADPRTYLDKLRGVDRAELAARIDRFLDTAPPPAFDADAFARFRADPGREELVTQILSAETLIELRAAAAATKREVAEALAKRLGLGAQTNAVRARYHDVETGNVDPGRVTSRVWDALAGILGASAERVRAAAERTFSGASGQAGAAFARSEPAGRAAPSNEAGPAEELHDDAVDQVFFDA